MIIGNKKFDANHTYVMGILNVTPDSFFDGARYDNLDAAIRRAVAIQEEVWKLNIVQIQMLVIQCLLKR